MKRSARCLTFLVPLLLGSPALAKDLPNFNAYYQAKAVAPAKPSVKPAAPAFVASIDDRRGVPTFLWSARGAGSLASPGALASLTAEGAARIHLDRHAARYGLSPAALSTAEVVETHDLGRGGIIVRLQQKVGGVPLFHSDVKVLMDRSFELVAIAGNLHAAAVPSPKGAAFKVPEDAAIALALSDLYGVAFGAGDLSATKKIKADYRYYDLAASAHIKAPKLHFTTPARVKKVFFPLPDRIVPAYFLELMSGDVTETSSDAYGYVIAADDGRLLYRDNLTHNDAFTYRVWADGSGDLRPTDGPLADYTPHPTGIPDGSYPPFVSPILVTIDGFNKNPQNTFDPWLTAGAMVTTGNNVDAYTDNDAPDGFSPGDIRASITGANTFDRTYDTSLGPQTNDNQRMAAVGQIFYVTNWLHDWWYDSGFNEAAGNAQQSNYGRGGIEGDPLHAEGQDGAPNSRNNANMSANADGESPRMQMYVWDGKGTATLNVTPPNQNLQNATATFGPQSFNVTGTVVLVNDGNGTTTDACQPITNNVSGQIALIDRGNCTFKQKAQAAQTAGAIAVILVNNQANQPPPQPQGNPGGVNIPMMGITMEDGAAVKASLMNGPVTATLTNSGSVDRDGTIDNSVVAHEWGHYLHLRQVSCGSTMCSGQSEGWADFNALMMVVRPGDKLDGTYALTQYATVAFPDPGYFGIRRYPYSTDMSKEPLTFKHISNGQALPAGIPISPAAPQNAEPHNVGEVWAAMLFEGYMGLVAKTAGPNPPYDYAAAHRRMSDYVVAGMKMAPADPTITEQRDGVLAAAAAADEGDFVTLAQAFAKRGAGSCAVSPPRDSTDLVGVVESFTVNPNITIESISVDDSVLSCDMDGVLDAGETGHVTVKILSAGPASMSDTKVTVTSTTPGVTFPSGPTVTVPPLAAYASATATIDIAIDTTVLKKQTMALNVVVANPDACNAQTSLDDAPLVNYDKVPMSSTTDDVESSDSPWTPTGDTADKIWSRSEPTPGNHVWRGIDNPSPSDTALVSTSLKIDPAANFVVSFDHRHQFEFSMNTNWDGGVIEVSTDNGGTWADISKFGDPGYGGTIGDPQNQAKNVLKGRDGYVDHNPSWPMTDHVSVDLGQKLAGKTALIRFRIGTDDAAGEYGWDVDNLSFQGITNKPFTTLVDDATPCEMQPTSSASSSGSSGAGGGMSTGTTSTTSGGVGGGATSGTSTGTGTGGAGANNGNPQAFGGCGCFVAGERGDATYAAPLFLLSALLLRRRRRS
jgi:large repetitive protein